MDGRGEGARTSDEHLLHTILSMIADICLTVSQLLVKILETHPQIRIDTAAVVAAWPADKLKPSPRAISEQLGKMRKEVGGDFIVHKLNSHPSAPSTPRRRGRKIGTTSTSAAKMNAETPTAGEKRKRDRTIKNELECVVDRLEEEGDEDGDDEDGLKEEAKAKGTPNAEFSAAGVEALRREPGLFNIDEFDVDAWISLVQEDDDEGNDPGTIHDDVHNDNDDDDSPVLESPTKRARVDQTQPKTSARQVTRNGASGQKSNPYAIPGDEDEDDESEDDDDDDE